MQDRNREPRVEYRGGYDSSSYSATTPSDAAETPSLSGKASHSSDQSAGSQRYSAELEQRPKKSRGNPSVEAPGLPAPPPPPPAPQRGTLLSAKEKDRRFWAALRGEIPATEMVRERY